MRRKVYSFQPCQVEQHDEEVVPAVCGAVTIIIGDDPILVEE